MIRLRYYESFILDNSMRRAYIAGSNWDIWSLSCTRLENWLLHIQRLKISRNNFNWMILSKFTSDFQGILSLLLMKWFISNGVKMSIGRNMLFIEWFLPHDTIPASSNRLSSRFITRGPPESPWNEHENNFIKQYFILKNTNFDNGWNETALSMRQMTNQSIVYQIK